VNRILKKEPKMSTRVEKLRELIEAELAIWIENTTAEEQQELADMLDEEADAAEVRAYELSR